MTCQEPSNGTLVNNGDGTFRYTPNADFSGTDQFVYEVCDTAGQCDTARVTIRVTPVNDAPVAVDDLATTASGTPVPVPVLANDHDVDGTVQAATVTVTTLPSNGTVAVDHETGTVTYTPAVGFRGTDTFGYTVADDLGAVSSTATVTITVDNALPLLADDTAVAPPGTAVAIPVLVNDGDVNADVLEVVSIATPPSNGTATFTPEGEVLYTPEEGFTGTDTFTYTVSDGQGGTASAVVTVQVDAERPRAVADQAGTPVERSVTIDVLANDLDPNGEAVTVIEVSAPAMGTVVDNTDGTVTYTPNEGFTGLDTFTYTIADETGNTAIAGVLVVVREGVPRAEGDQALTQVATAVTIPVLENDSSPTGSPLAIAQVTNGASGTVAIHDNGTPEAPGDDVVVYTPAPERTGLDTFTYTIVDEQGRTALAAVTVRINAPPIAEDDRATIPEETSVTIAILDNDRDEDGTLVPTAITAVTPPTNGTVEVNANGTVTYTPTLDFFGIDTFTYTVSDDQGSSSNVATVSLTITAVNDAPGFTRGPNQQVVEDTGPQSVSGWATSITPGPPNEAPQALTFLVTPDTPALFATLPAIDSTGTLTYTPAPNANGSTTVTVRLQDDGGTANGGSDTSPPQTFTLTVIPVNDAPGFTPGPNQRVLEDTGPQTVPDWAMALSPGPPDEAGQTLTFRVTANSNPALFAAGPTLRPDGTLAYTPAPNATGTATVPVVLQDDGGTANGGQDTSPAQPLTITVVPVNDAPSFTSGPPQTILEDAGPQMVSGWATNIRPGPANETAQTVTFLVTTNPATLFAVPPTIDATGTLAYTPAPNANGTASVTVQLQDNGGTANGGRDTSPAQTFTISITAVNDAPSFTQGGNQRVAEDAGLQTVPGWATSIRSGPANEAAQTVTFLSETTNPTLFAAPPTIDSTGTLTYAPAPNANGSTTVTVRLQDDGGTANDGSDTSPPQTFTLTVTAVNDAPGFTPGPNQRVREDAGPQSVPAWATALSPGPPDEAEQTLAFLVANTNTALFAVQPALDTTGTLTYTPADNANGTALVTVRLRDNGGTANGGVNTSDPQTFQITVTAINDPPELLPIGNQAVDEGASLTGPVTALDQADADQLTLTATEETDPFADNVISFLPGTYLFDTVPPAPGEELQALGAPDGLTLPLGLQGEITLRFVDNVVIDGPGDDVQITAFSPTGSVEDNQAEVLGSEDGRTFVSLGTIGPAPASAFGVNLAGTGLTQVRFVRIVDSGQCCLSGNPTGGGEGFNIDSVAALNSAPGTQTLPAFATFTDNGNGTGTLELTPGSEDAGIYQVTIVVTDDGTPNRSASETVTITVNDVNLPPTATDDSDVTNEDTPITITVLTNDRDPDGRLDPTTVTIATPPSNGSAVVNPDGTVTYTPNVNALAPDSFTYTVNDNDGALSNVATVTIEITAVNDAPSFEGDGDQMVLEDAGAQRVPAWATNLSPGPPDEAGQTLTFLVSTATPALFATPPAIDPAGTLTYTLAPNANGTATVMVQLQDDGGTANGGVDTSAAQSFTITVTAVNDVPSFTAGPDQTAREDAGLVSIPAWVTNLSPGPLDEADQTLTFLVSCDNRGLFDVPPTIEATETLTYTLAPNANGVAICTVQLQDNGGTANGGVDTSPAQPLTITVTPVNDAPSFAAGPEQNVLEDAGSQSVPAWATNIRPGPANEAGQTLTFLPTPDTPALFTTPPAIDSAGTLTYTPAPHTNGTTTVTVRLQDDGGTDNGGMDTSPPRTFTITVVDARPPRFDNIQIDPDLAGTGTLLTVTFTASEPLQANPAVTVAGNPATFNRVIDLTFTYTYTVHGTEPEGPVPIAITGTDRAGNPGAGAGSVTLDLTPPVATLTFPGASLITYTDVTVRGTAEDASEITNIEVNGVPATSPDGFATWEATIPLPLGPQTLTVSTTDEAGNVDEEAVFVSVEVVEALDGVSRGAGAPFMNLTDIAVEPVSDQLVVLDFGLNAVLRVNPNTGNRRVISGCTVPTRPCPAANLVGDGVEFVTPTGIAVVEASGQILVVDRALAGVLRVNPNTGNRRVISGCMVPTRPCPAANLVGDGVEFVTPTDLAIEGTANQIVVVDVRLDAVLRVELSTGNRTVMSGCTVRTNPCPATNLIGDGQPFDGLPEEFDGIGPDQITVDPLSGQLLVSDRTFDAVFRVEPDTGERAIVSGCTVTTRPCPEDALIGDGPPFAGGFRSLTATAAGQWFVGDPGSIVQVDPNTGNRVVVSADLIGNGVPFQGIADLASEPSGHMVVADFPRNAVWRVDTINGDRVFLALSDVNRPPQLTDLDDLTVAEDATQTVPVSTFDLDGDEITLTAANLPAFATFSDDGGGNGTLTLMPGFDAAGIFPNVTITATDNGTPPLTDTITFSIEVTNVNRVPIASADTATTNEDVAVDVDVLANDSDADDDGLTVLDVTQGANGTVAITAAGTVRYTPAPDFHGADSFTYTISDTHDGRASGQVTLRVTAMNDPPSFTPGPDQQVLEDAGPQAVPGWATNISSGPPDEAGQTLTFLLTTANDALFTVPPTLDVTGTLRYTPALNANGTATVLVQLQDSGGTANGGQDTSADQTFTITITPVNDEPVAVEDTATTPTNTPVTIDVVDNDTDVDGTVDPTSVTLFDSPPNGIAVSNDNGTIDYAPNPRFRGIDTFTYTVRDDAGALSDVASVSVTVINAPPEAQDDSATTLPGNIVLIPVLVNDADANADPVTITRIVTPPDLGTVGFTQEGTVIYTPSVEFPGPDSFTYEISDDQGETATAVVTITVDDVTPSAVADQATTPVDIPVTIPVLANDADPNGDRLTITLVSTPIRGTAEINTAGTVTYTPAPGFVGLDTFTYTIDDGQGQTNTAVVVVRVDDIAPHAAGDGAVTQMDTLAIIDVLANDSDPNADPALLTITAFSQGANGTVTRNDNATPGNPRDDVLEYVPGEGFSGLDTFTYTIEDDSGQTAQAAVTVFVNAPPVAIDDTAVTNLDTPVTIPVLDNDTDSEGPLDPASVAVVIEPANGTAVVNPDGTVTYTPNAEFTGTDTFTYTITDATGGIATASVTVTVNAPPVANDDTTTMINQGTGTSFVIIPVLDNDTDSDGTLDRASLAVVTGPANGTAVVNADGTITYTPVPTFFDTDTFTYSVSDNQGSSDTATVSVAVFRPPIEVRR